MRRTKMSEMIIRTIRSALITQKIETTPPERNARAMAETALTLTQELTGFSSLAQSSNTATRVRCVSRAKYIK